MLGRYDKVSEAGAVVIGGHTIEDDEPKYGLAAVGTVVDDLAGARGPLIDLVPEAPQVR